MSAYGRHLLAAPLVPAAACAVGIAIAARAGTLPALASGILCVALATALALASAERRRRLMWAGAACVAGAAAVRALVPLDLMPVDLVHAGPLDAVRDALGEPLRRLVPEPEGGILRGIVLGERASVDADLAAAFARSGTTHLLAISGFNMTLVATAVALLARGRLRPPLTAVVTVSSVAAYSVLVGLGPSVLRAALMAGVASLALAYGRRAATANALALAVAAMLLIDPGAIADVGFELSALATAGLLFLNDPIARRLGALPPFIRDGLATTLAATLPTLPLVAAVFGRVSLISPLANLIAVPLFPPLMVAGAATAAAGAVSLDLARPLALIAYGLAFAFRAVVEHSAATPLASLAVPDGPIAGAAFAVVVALAVRYLPAALVRAGTIARRPLVLAIAALRRARSYAPGVVSPRVRTPTVAIVAGALAAIAVAGCVAVTAEPPPPLRVVALDVGQGDAFLVRVAGATALVDGGPDPNRLLAELGATLPPWTRRIDLVALTHAHIDHAAGLLAVLERYEVGLAIEPVGLNAGPVADAWNDRIARGGIARRALAAGARLRLGDASISVLAPEEDPRVDVPSLVLRLERAGFSALFMGDATDQAQADLLLHPAPLAARVYVPPHHGAATPHASALVAAVRPAAALISVGAGNRYGHPTPETLAALSGIRTYRTDRDGTVEIDQGGTGLAVRTHANGLPPPRGGSVPHAPASR